LKRTKYDKMPFKKKNLLVTYHYFVNKFIESIKDIKIENLNIKFKKILNSKI